MTETATAASAPITTEAAGITEADFPRLVKQHQAMVFSIAYHSLRDRAAAEELAQDVFLQLYRNLDRMESAAHVTHWLRRVASHRAIDQIRKRGGLQEVDLESVPEPANDAEVQDPLLHDRLRKLVASLPARKRLLVILRYQEEMEFEEIGRALRIPARTVRTQLFRTIALLREKASHLLESASGNQGETA